MSKPAHYTREVRMHEMISVRTFDTYVIVEYCSDRGNKGKMKTTDTAMYSRAEWEDGMEKARGNPFRVRQMSRRYYYFNTSFWTRYMKYGITMPYFNDVMNHHRVKTEDLDEFDESQVACWDVQINLFWKADKKRPMRCPLNLTHALCLTNQHYYMKEALAILKERKDVEIFGVTNTELRAYNRSGPIVLYTPSQQTWNRLIDICLNEKPNYISPGQIIDHLFPHKDWLTTIPVLGLKKAMRPKKDWDDHERSEWDEDDYC